MKTLIEDRSLAKKRQELMATISLIQYAQQHLGKAVEAAVDAMIADGGVLDLDGITDVYRRIGDAADWQVVEAAAGQIQQAYEATHDEGNE